jgi:hypothetical protein
MAYRKKSAPKLATASEMQLEMQSWSRDPGLNISTTSPYATPGRPVITSADPATVAGGFLRPAERAGMGTGTGTPSTDEPQQSQTILGRGSRSRATRRKRTLLGG